MCIICLDIEKNKITSKDAQWALLEMANKLDDEHYEEVLQKIESLEAKDEFKRLLKLNKTVNFPKIKIGGPNE